MKINESKYSPLVNSLVVCYSYETDLNVPASFFIPHDF